MGGLEHRQATAMQQVVDQRGDEDGLAGARQAGDAEPQGRLDQAAGAIGKRVEGDQRLIGDGSDGMMTTCGPLPWLVPI